METFVLRIDGTRLGLGRETAARIRLRIQGRDAIKDDTANGFVFPHTSNLTATAVGLPFTVTLPTDMPAAGGPSTTLGYEVTVTTDVGGRVGPVLFAAQPAGSTVGLEDLAETVVTPVTDLAGYTARAEAAARAAETAPMVRSVNGDPGDPTTGAVYLGLTGLTDVTITPTGYDDTGTPVPGTGPTAGDYVGYDPVTQEWVNRPVTGFAPQGWVAPYTLRGVVLTPGDILPSDLPADALVFDEADPSAKLLQTVNTVAVSGAALTLPAPTVATIHEVTLTAACTLTLPTPQPGGRIMLLLRQDPTGGRVVTWPAGTKWPGGTPPTLSTSPGAEDVVELVSVSGAAWRMVGTVSRYTSSAQPGPTPTVRGGFSANSGAVNNNTQVSTTLPAAAAAGDLGYMLVTMNGSTATMTTPPAGWTLLDGPVSTTAMTSWLFRRVLAAGDGGGTVTSGVMGTGGRPSMTGVVLTGGTTTGETRAAAQPAGVDTNVVVPPVTPTVGNSLLVLLSGLRSTASTTPQSVTPTPGWVEQVEHHEGRWDGTNVNFGGYAQTRGLTGGANTTQGGTNATTTVTLTEHSWVVAVPPPVT